jgi:hypothetical protein
MAWLKLFWSQVPFTSKLLNWSDWPVYLKKSYGDIACSTIFFGGDAYIVCSQDEVGG